jgi:hypothetical protein
LSRLATAARAVSTGSPGPPAAPAGLARQHLGQHGRAALDQHAPLAEVEQRPGGVRPDEPQAATRLDIDRTTMVAQLDALEAKGWSHGALTPTTGAGTWSS